MAEKYNITHWMLLNGDKLADAIVADKKLDGEHSGPLLTEAQQLPNTGKQKHEAKKILRRKLVARGFGYLLEED